MPQVRVGGVYGVGKTTIIEGSLEKLSREYAIQIPKIKGSEIMAEVLDIHPDLLPEQPEALRVYARQVMYDKIARISHGVRDGHFSVITDKNEYEFPRSETDRQCVGALIIVTADVEAIAERRAVLGRAYRSKDFDEISAHQRVEMEVAQNLAIELEVPLYIVDNSGDSPYDAIEKVGAIILKHSNPLRQNTK